MGKQDGSRFDSISEKMTANCQYVPLTAGGHFLL